MINNVSFGRGFGLGISETKESKETKKELTPNEKLIRSVSSRHVEAKLINPEHDIERLNVHKGQEKSKDKTKLSPDEKLILASEMYGRSQVKKFESK